MSILSYCRLSFLLDPYMTLVHWNYKKMVFKDILISFWQNLYKAHNKLNRTLEVGPIVDCFIRVYCSTSMRCNHGCWQEKNYFLFSWNKKFYAAFFVFNDFILISCFRWMEKPCGMLLERFFATWVSLKEDHWYH